MHVARGAGVDALALLAAILGLFTWIVPSSPTNRVLRGTSEVISGSPTHATSVFGSPTLAPHFQQNESVLRTSAPQAEQNISGPSFRLIPFSHDRKRNSPDMVA